LRLPAVEDWLRLARRMGSAAFICGDYRVTLSSVQSGDSVYLDPPYFDSTGREMFARYTLAGFSRSDHEALAVEVKRLTTIGAKVVMTVREDAYIRELYKGN
jgi:DNA adenine methylase